MIISSAIKSIEFKSLAVICVLALFVAGCSENKEINLWWDLAKFEGHYPISGDRGAIYINGHRAFIKSTSILVDCEGRPLKIGDRTLFLERKRSSLGFSYVPSVLGYNTSAKRVDVSYSLPTVAEIKGRPAQITETIFIDTSLSRTNAAKESQCVEADPYWRTFNSFNF